MTNGNDSIHNSEQGTQDGLTKREYFAAMAMQGMVANSTASVKTALKETNVNAYARESVMLADALINALNKKEQTNQLTTQ